MVDGYFKSALKSHNANVLKRYDRNAYVNSYLGFETFYEQQIARSVNGAVYAHQMKVGVVR